MQVLNHGSRWPTNGVAIARYTRGSIEDGPGVSINRTGGFNSPTVCVMACPSNRAVLGGPACAPEDHRSAAGSLIFSDVTAKSQQTNWLLKFRMELERQDLRR